jgi:hypothetical protein
MQNYYIVAVTLYIDKDLAINNKEQKYKTIQNYLIKDINLNFKIPKYYRTIVFNYFYKT